MGLLDLFSKDGRDSIKSKLEYDQCYKDQQEKLLSYRKNAIQEILFKYPDARILLNRLDQRFMVILASQGLLLVGKFADAYYPRLDYVSDFSSTEERRVAITQFNHQISLCVGNISQEAMPRFKNARCWVLHEVTNLFQSKGYAITGRAKLKYLIGGAMFLNKRQIAKATIWDTKPKGYFNAKLFDEVVQETDHRPGIQVLTFVTVDADPVGQGQEMSYEIIFDRSLHYFDKDNRNEFSDSIINLRDFIYALEDYFRPDCPGGDEDRLEYSCIHSAKRLDSPERNEDQSIESRYIL